MYEKLQIGFYLSNSRRTVCKVLSQTGVKPFHSTSTTWELKKWFRNIHVRQNFLSQEFEFFIPYVQIKGLMKKATISYHFYPHLPIISLNRFNLKGLNDFNKLDPLFWYYHDLIKKNNLKHSITLRGMLCFKSPWYIC